MSYTSQLEYENKELKAEVRHLEEYIADQRDRLERLRGDLKADHDGWALTLARLHRIEEERDELAAEVERLRALVANYEFHFKEIARLRHIKEAANEVQRLCAGIGQNIPAGPLDDAMNALRAALGEKP